MRYIESLIFETFRPFNCHWGIATDRIVTGTDNSPNINNLV